MKFERLASLYTGATAASYEAERAASSQWLAEDAALDSYLNRLPRGSRVLDVPVGTGRFLELYVRHGLNAVGIDISPDMLRLATEKAAALGLAPSLALGDVRKLAFPDASFDASICMRLLNWIDAKHIDAVLAEFSRVTRSMFVLSVKVYPVAGSWEHASNRLKNLWRQLRGAGMVTHDRRQLDLQLEGHGFWIEEARTIGSDRRGASYLIYLLRRERLS
jgi:SAM-dependent methyltransferase